MIKLSEKAFLLLLFYILGGSHKCFFQCFYWILNFCYHTSQFQELSHRFPLFSYRIIFLKLGTICLRLFIIISPKCFFSLHYFLSIICTFKKGLLLPLWIIFKRWYSVFLPVEKRQRLVPETRSPRRAGLLTRHPGWRPGRSLSTPALAPSSPVSEDHSLQMFLWFLVFAVNFLLDLWKFFIF